MARGLPTRNRPEAHTRPVATKVQPPRRLYGASVDLLAVRAMAGRNRIGERCGPSWRSCAAAARGFVRARGAFRFVSLARIFLTVIAGAVQATIDTGDFKTFWDGVWWAVVTVTTVGYGDVYPMTVGGRIVAIVLMLTGIGFLAVLTATVSSRFVKKSEATRRPRSRTRSLASRQRSPP